MIPKSGTGLRKRSCSKKKLEIRSACHRVRSTAIESGTPAPMNTGRRRCYLNRQAPSSSRTQMLRRSAIRTGGFDSGTGARPGPSRKRITPNALAARSPAASTRATSGFSLKRGAQARCSQFDLLISRPFAVQCRPARQRIFVHFHSLGEPGGKRIKKENQELSVSTRSNRHHWP